MSEREYEDFVTAARAGPVPDGFTDDVMQRIESDAEPQWGTPILRIAAWAAAILVLALRVGGALAVFWTA